MTVVPEGFYEIDGLMFGGRGIGPVYVQNFSIGTVEWEDQDRKNPVGHNITFGRDYMVPAKWTFEFAIVAEDAPAALLRLEEMTSKWRMDGLANVPQREVVIRYTKGGRTRRVYGRPRRFDPDFNIVPLRSGALVALAEFQTRDPFFYDDEEMMSNPISIITPAGVGFTAPFTAPIQTLQGGERQGIIDDVGGTVNAPFKAIINGPISNPYVYGDGWRMQVTTNLAAGQSITIDTGRNTVIRNDGTQLSGFLTWDSRFSDAKLRPGPDEFAFGGTDATGTATAQIYWRKTYNSL